MQRNLRITITKLENWNTNWQPQLTFERILASLALNVYNSTTYLIPSLIKEYS